jgi:hypothetical protein
METKKKNKTKSGNWNRSILRFLEKNKT